MALLCKRAVLKSRYSQHNVCSFVVHVCKCVYTHLSSHASAYTNIHTFVSVHQLWYVHCVVVSSFWYGVATISRLLKIIGLFFRISSLLQGSFAKETYNFKEPTNRSHPICISLDPQNGLSCRSFSAKEPPIIGLFFVRISLQGNEDPQKALSCRSFSEPPIIGLFCGK